MNPDGIKIVRGSFESPHYAGGHPDASSPNDGWIHVSTHSGHLDAEIKGSTMHIGMIDVHPDARREGLGRRLLRAAELEALHRGVTLVQGDAWTGMGVPFCRAAGYTVGGRSRIIPGALVVKKKLSLGTLTPETKEAPAAQMSFALESITRFLDLFERQDAEMAQQLRAHATKVLKAYREFLSGHFDRVFGRHQRVSGEDSHKLRHTSLTTFKHGGAVWIFSHPFGDSQHAGVFREPNFISLYEEGFRWVMKLAEARTDFIWLGTHSEPNWKRRRTEARRNAKEAIVQSLAVIDRLLQDHDFIGTMAHEMTHLKDHQQFPMDQRAQKANADLTQMKAQPGSLDFNKVYMAQNHEHNAYFLGALTTIHQLQQKFPNYTPDFETFRKEFIHYYGPNHWALTPEKHRRAILARLWQAWQNPTAPHPDEGTPESTPRFFNLFERQDAPDLQALYQQLNTQFFDNRLPQIPITWAPLKRVGGRVRFKVQPIPGQTQPTPFMVKLGRESRYKGHGLIPESLNMQISNLFQRGEDVIKGIMMHEMVHVWMAAVDHHYEESHGPNFLAMIKSLEGRCGFSIPLTDEIGDAPLADQGKLRTVCVYVTPRGAYTGMALVEPKAFRAALLNGKLTSFNRLLKKTMSVYEVTSPAWTRLSYKYPVGRKGDLMGHYKMANDAPELGELTAPLLQFERGEITGGSMASA